MSSAATSGLQGGCVWQGLNVVKGKAAWMSWQGISCGFFACGLTGCLRTLQVRGFFAIAHAESSTGPGFKEPGMRFLAGEKGHARLRQMADSRVYFYTKNASDASPASAVSYIFNSIQVFQVIDFSARRGSAFPARLRVRT